jgi:UDP:flavonoid glycosyltransferase YjiC (YdhE family)
MRILMSTNRGAGHVGPLIPFAHAFMRAGQQVLVAAPRSARDLIVGAGLPYHPLVDPPQDELDPVYESLPRLSREEAGVRMMRDVFAGIDARASLPGVLRAAADYRPAIVLREPTEYAGLLASERLGIPHGRIGIMAAAAETWSVPIVAPVLDGHRKRLGLRPDPLGLRIADSPYLTVMPAALEEPEDRGPAHALRFREIEPAARPLPDWWVQDDRPLVYVTYGSVMPTLPQFPPLFRATVEALADLPARVLFTVGTEVELESLGAAPAGIRVERWVPQADVMPHAAAVVGHGGSGTTRMALAAGVPSVIVPAFADQFRNAERVAALGAGIALQGGTAAIAGLREAVQRLLDEPSYRTAARRVAAEVAQLPTVDAAPAALRDSISMPQAA